MNDLVFQLTISAKLKFDTNALARVESFRQHSPSLLEAGGVLLGRFIKDSDNIIIDAVSIPMIGDKRTRNTFKRGAFMHQRVIDWAWLKSKGTCNYLGEWHTHPEKYPTPSLVDWNDWKRKLKEDTFSGRFLYFVIVGIKEICIWQGDREKMKFKKLEKI